MTHVQIPDFTPAPGAVRLMANDPILAAIQAHAEAWSMFQVAPCGVASERAETTMDTALEELLATPCGSWFGALALVRHLRWVIREEAFTAESGDVLCRVALAREADLSRFVGSDLPPEWLPRAMPLGRLAAQVVRHLPPVAPMPPAPAAGRARYGRSAARVAGAAGEVLAAVAIVGGGMLLTGLATLF